MTELLTQFNRALVQPESAIALELTPCPQPPGLEPEPLLRRRGRSLLLCYELLQQLDDHFDDLSGSLTEQHLAVLDAVYLLVARELSQIILEETEQFSPELVQELPPLLGDGPKNGPKNRPGGGPDAIDQLTAQLPGLLQLQSQTVILSGSQWLFNQGNPLLSPKQLQHWGGQPLGLENYPALVCGSYRRWPGQFPFLASELPAQLPLTACLDPPPGS